MNIEKKGLPLFSIITICYNEENRIQQTLDSVSSQIYKNFEHIIEDGKSEDATCVIVEKNSNKYLEGQLRIFSEEDYGLYDAMNRAVARARGEYICFINSGDYLFDENTLENVAREIENTPNMDWYYGECIVIFPNGDEYFQMPTTIENISGNDIKNKLQEKHLNLNHQTIFAHKTCFDDNLFDVRLKMRAELKWYYKCLLGKKKVKGLGFPVCKYTFGGLSERVSSMEIHKKEMKTILKEFELLDDRNKLELPKENDYTVSYKNIYSTWLALHQAGRAISDYLTKNGVNCIAVYGYAELGTHLINELKQSKIEIRCVIDRQKRYPYLGIPVVHPEEFVEEVDLIIVTAVAHYKEIEVYMKRMTDCQITSLEDILESAWW